MGAGVGSVAASLFGIGSGRRTTSSQEVPIAALIEQKSVRTVGRNTTSTNTATAVSFVLRVLGSEGTECAASFKTAHQRVS